MSKKLEDIKIGADFDIKDAVAITDEAAQRTRWLTIVLVIATVIIFIGFYNSTEWSWSFHRIASIYDNEFIRNINSANDKPENLLLDSYFGTKDFRDFKGFACRIYDEKSLVQSQTTLLSGYLFSRFTEKLQKMLENECAGETRDVEASASLTNSFNFELNIALKDKFLYKQETFKKIAKSEETQNYLQLLNQESGISSPVNLKEKDLLRLNRLLLEDAYRQRVIDGYRYEILKSRDIIPIDGSDDGNIMTPEQKRRLNRQSERVRAEVDNVQNIAIPVFGITIDVNDLGTFGGLSVFIILFLLRYSLSREIKNLNMSFKEAFCHNKLPAFYHSLAMRQVLTVPQMKGEVKNDGLVVGAKLLCLFPFVVMFLGVVYDYISVLKLSVFEFQIAYLTMITEVIFLVFIFYLSLRCLERQIHIDRVWEDYWEIVKALRNDRTPDELVGEGFAAVGNKKLINIIDRRITDEPQKNDFWLYELLARIPGFIRWFRQKFFAPKRFARLLPPQSFYDWLGKHYRRLKKFYLRFLIRKKRKRKSGLKEKTNETAEKSRVDDDKKNSSPK